MPVAIITGENGAGKTILLDAIRGLFGLYYGSLERAIWRNAIPFRAEAALVIEGARRTLSSTGGASMPPGFYLLTSDQITMLPYEVQQGQAACPNWIVDYWRSALPADAYTIQHLAQQDPRHFLINSLKGIQRNARGDRADLGLRLPPGQR